MQDSVEVKISLRRRIRIPDEIIQNGSIYTWSLTLLEIRSYDFGVYRAGLRSLQRLGTTCSSASETMYQSIIVRDEYACEFNLSHIVDYYKYVNAPVGALLSFARLHIHSKSDFLRVEHYINGKPLSMIPNITRKAVLFFFSEVIWTGMPLYLPRTKMIYDLNLQQSEVLGEVCMCSSLYGLHRFKFYNDIYDIKRNTWITSEFWYPQITVVYPSPSIMPWKYRSKLESKLFDSSKNERNFFIFEGPAFELLQSNLDDDFVVMEVIDRCLILYLFCIIIALACLSLFYLLRLVSTFKGYAYERLGLIIRCQCYHYDVFILNVDDDRTFVLYELYPVLAERQLSVLLSEEHPRPGPKLDTLKQAPTASKKVIVVISDGSINDKYYNNFFLPHIVLHRLDKGKIGSRHLMLLVSETCLVPESLITDNRIVTLDSTRNPKDIVLRKLKEWLDSPVITDGFGERPVLHSDLLQLY
ncbi:hypothetical protein ACJMK2_000657 [Sinanodonta woodiana]|uniref:TIR domain-containing protein n=1 Tax=Sinanodonta woodiana TaxID=1069815 RepID=A0ABD3XRT8_SINWO